MKRPTYQPKYKRGEPASTRNLPEGWRDHDYAYGAITPTIGQWAGTPMMAHSNMASLLGWPNQCVGNIKYCLRYPDGSDAVPIFKDGIIIGRKLKRVKDTNDPPSIKANGGWIDTGLIQLAWVDYDGNKVEVNCRKKRLPLRQSTDQETRVLPKKNRHSS